MTFEAASDRPAEPVSAPPRSGLWFPGMGTGLLTGASFAFLLQGLGLALTYLLHVFLARWLGPAGYGSYAYVLSWATILGTVAALGLPLVALRYVSQHAAARRWGELRGMVAGGSRIVWAGGLSIAGLGAITAYALSANPRLWVIGLACVPLLAQLTFGAEVARALGSVLRSVFPPRVLRPVATLGLLAVVWHWTPDPGTAMALTAAGIAAAVAIQWLWVRALLPQRARSAAPVLETRLWIRTGLPMMVGIGANLLVTQLDLLMVGLLMDGHATGLYSAAARTAAIIPFVLYAFNIAAAPAFAALHETGDRGELQRLATTVVRWAFWPSLALAVVLAGSAGWILSWFGEAFVVARAVVAIVAAGYVFSAGVGSVGYLLNLTGHEGRNARTLLWACVLDIGLNLVLIPVWGIHGAAVATTVTWIFVGARLHYLVHRHMGIRASVLARPGRKERS